YTNSTYGFNQEQSDQFLEALFAVPYQIGQGRVLGVDDMSIKQLLDSVTYVDEALATLKPLRNKNEFEHYRLMARTRALYVSYQYVEHRANSPDFAVSDIPVLLRELKEIIAKIKKVNAGYLKLN